MNLMMSLGLPLDLRFIEIALPIAISFMTFHALSYIIDVYHRKFPPPARWSTSCSISASFPT
jgi:D-alanyl-lipoteichoic acid acyltransferase DltB (MBOAT superfamily)